MTEPISIQIVSDVVCPWCYVGKRRLEKALAQRPGLAVEVTWLPFQLSPDMPREGTDRREHYATIFGAERAEQIMGSMKNTGAAEGIAFDTPPGARSPNTLSAHVLLYWASCTPGVDQNALAERLFSAHHERGEDIGSHAMLTAVAAETGMDVAEVSAGLKAGSDEDAVQALIEQARQAGVSGVPFFVVGGQYALSGAQPPEAFLQVLDELSGGAPARLH
jgi:predicted DsbA family dithiol-disulfide isomerase